jgi:hypothetical protein
MLYNSKGPYNVNVKFSLVVTKSGINFRLEMEVV